MSKPIIKILDLETNELVEREMNDEEFAQWEKDKAEFDAKKSVEAAATAQRQALLDKLGITEDEARLLLGGN